MLLYSTAVVAQEAGAHLFGYGDALRPLYYKPDRPFSVTEVVDQVIGVLNLDYNERARPFADWQRDYDTWASAAVSGAHDYGRFNWQICGFAPKPSPSPDASGSPNPSGAPGAAPAATPTPVTPTPRPTPPPRPTREP